MLSWITGRFLKQIYRAGFRYVWKRLEVDWHWTRNDIWKHTILLAWSVLFVSGSYFFPHGVWYSEARRDTAAAEHPGRGSSGGSTAATTRRRRGHHPALQIHHQPPRWHCALHRLNAAVSATQIHRLMHTLKTRARGGGSLDIHNLKSLFPIYCSTKIVNPDPQQQKITQKWILWHLHPSVRPPPHLHRDLSKTFSENFTEFVYWHVFFSFHNYKHIARRSCT